MAGKRKPPTLRVHKGRYYRADIWRPDGKRTSISFGTAAERTEGEIYVAFGRWLDLFRQQPEKVLSHKSPYDAIQQVLNPTCKLTVGELLARYLEHAKKTARPVRGKQDHPSIRFIKRAQEFLTPYRDWPARDFGPDELRDVQHAVVAHRYLRGKTEKRYTRRGVNDTIKWIRTIWKWAMGRQFVTAEHVQGLAEVKPLRMGDTDAPDNRRRHRVTEDDFRKVIKVVPRVIADMLQLIWHTGMRPYEVCGMRPFDLLHDDPDCWLYIPGRDQTPVGKHKTTHHEKVKVIPLTLKSQKILSPRIKNFSSKKYIFSPEETMQDIRAQRYADRQTPLSCGNRPGTNRKEHPMIKPGKLYSSGSLCHACKRGCKRAGVEAFVPYDLRRTMATGTRSLLGKEAARVLLGHTKTETTDIYLLEEVQEAIRVAKQLASRQSSSA